MKPSKNQLLQCFWNKAWENYYIKTENSLFIQVGNHIRNIKNNVWHQLNEEIDVWMKKLNEENKENKESINR